MDGKTLKAGSVVNCSNIKHPITVASKIMKYSPFVMLCGKGAEQFAAEYKIEMAEDEYFFSQHRYSQFLKAKKQASVQLDHTPDEEKGVSHEEKLDFDDSKKFGTVGAVAIDQCKYW